MLEHQRVIENTWDEVQEELVWTPGTEAESSSFAAAEDAFFAVVKRKTDLLNAGQVVERELREELAKEKESHVVDIQNVIAHMAADVERLEKEKEELAKQKEELPARLRVEEDKFTKVNTVVKVFGQKAVSKFTKGFCPARAQLLEKNLDTDLSELNGLVKVTTGPNLCGLKFSGLSTSAPASPELSNQSS